MLDLLPGCSRLDPVYRSCRGPRMFVEIAVGLLAVYGLRGLAVAGRHCLIATYHSCHLVLHMRLLRPALQRLKLVRITVDLVCDLMRDDHA